MIEIGSQSPLLHIDEGFLAQQIHIGLPVFLNRPGVAPVSAEFIAVDPVPGPHHPRDDITPELKRGICLVFIKEFYENLGFEAKNSE